MTGTETLCEMSAQVRESGARERCARAACVRRSEAADQRTAHVSRSVKAPDGWPRSKKFARRRDADLFASSIEVEVAHGLFVDPDGGKETFADQIHGFAFMPAVIPAANDAIMEIAALMRIQLDWA